jgi:hypothetical protein
VQPLVRQRGNAEHFKHEPLGPAIEGLPSACRSQNTAQVRGFRVPFRGSFATLPYQFRHVHDRRALDGIFHFGDR